MLPPTKFLLKRIYGLEEDVGWRIPRWWLFSARQSLICKWDDYSYFWVSMLPEAFYQVSAQEDICFGKRCWLKNSKNGCLVLGNLWYANGMIIPISESPYCRKLSIKFLLKRIYGLEEDVGWRIPGWLFSARQSLICKWDDFSYFWVSFFAGSLPSSFYSRWYMVWKKLFTKFQEGCFVDDHHAKKK